MRIAKAVVAAVGTVVVVLTAALADDVVGASEAGAIAAAAVEGAITVWAVYRVPNQPAGGRR